MTARIRILLMSFCFALLLAPGFSAHAKDVAGCDNGALVNKRAGKLCDGCHRTFLGSKHDFVITSSVLSTWLPNNEPVMNKKSLYAIEEFARLIPIYPADSTLRYDVQSPAGTIALIEQNEMGYVRLVNMAGRVLFVTVNVRGKNECFSVAVGQELCIAEQSVPEKSLIPADSVAREAIGCTIYLPGVKMLKSTFDRTQMQDRESLMVCARDLANSGFIKNARKEIAKARQLPAYTVISEHRAMND
jgi:hypothetical protein